MRNAAGEFDHFEAALDIALGVGNGLAMLARQHICELVVVALRQFEEFHHDSGAALRVGVRPCFLCRLGVLDRGPDLGLGRQRHLGLDVARHRFEDVRGASRRALDLAAADEMSN